MRAPLVYHIPDVLYRLDAVMAAVGWWRYAIAAVGIALITVHLWTRYHQKED